MSGKTLILMRHAKSDWYSGESSDFRRPLNKRGKQDAPRVGAWLGEFIEVPELILCSSAKRTRETLDGVVSSAQWDTNTTQTLFADDLYLASTSTILSQISEAMGQHDNVMVVAHNPGLDMTFLELFPDAKHIAGAKLMTTAAVAILEFYPGFPLGAELVKFVRPKDLL